jgi:hypothetical protein
MASETTAGEVLESILAGRSAAKVAPLLIQLSPDERQNVLCTTCAMRDEIARNCVATGRQAEKLLTAECRFYINGTPTCLKT